MLVNFAEVSINLDCVGLATEKKIWIICSSKLTLKQVFLPLYA